MSDVERRRRVLALLAEGMNRNPNSPHVQDTIERVYGAQADAVLAWADTETATLRAALTELRAIKQVDMRDAALAEAAAETAHLRAQVDAVQQIINDIDSECPPEDWRERMP